MRKVMMKEAAIGSIDGIKVQSFEKGQVYNISDDLFDNFVKMQKIAEEIAEEYKAPKAGKKKKEIKEDEKEIKEDEKAITEISYNNKMIGDSRKK